MFCFTIFPTHYLSSQFWTALWLYELFTQSHDSFSNSFALKTWIRSHYSSMGHLEISHFEHSKSNDLTFVSHCEGYLCLNVLLYLFFGYSGLTIVHVHVNVVLFPQHVDQSGHVFYFSVGEFTLRNGGYLNCFRNGIRRKLVWLLVGFERRRVVSGSLWEMIVESSNLVHRSSYSTNGV